MKERICIHKRISIVFPREKYIYHRNKIIFS